MAATTPAGYLERLQERLYREAGQEPATRATMEAKLPADFLDQSIEHLGIKDPDLATRRRQEILDSLAEAEAERPTQFEDVGNYSLMRGLARTLVDAAGETGWSVPAIPVYGTLPLGQLNAMAVRVPDSGEYLIAFQQGVFGFANLLTKAVAASLPKDTSGEDGSVNFSFDLKKVEEAWADDGEPLQRFAELLGGYIVGGHPHAAQQYFLGQPFVTLAGHLRDSIELFIFGHEFGHIVAGHLEDANAASLNLGPVDLEQAKSNWEMEHEADYIGCVLTLLAMRKRGFDAALSYCGIDLFFTAIQIVDRALSVLVSGEVEDAQPESDTHPPSELRRQVLRERLSPTVGEENAASAVDLADNVEQVLELMWQRVEPMFERMHERGVSPAPMWRR